MIVVVVMFSNILIEIVNVCLPFVDAACVLTPMVTVTAT